jgi:hypothetical protein
MSFLPTTRCIIVNICYKDKGRSKKPLMEICYDLLNDEEERKIGDLSLEPFDSSRNNKLFTPSVKHFHVEIVRRADVTQVKAPRSSHYTKDQCYKWLMQHPTAHPVDITFLVEEEVKFKTKVEAAVKKVKAKKVLNWIGNDLFLCLYHCLINNTIKFAFLECDNVLDCKELDARKSDKKAWRLDGSSHQGKDKASNGVSKMTVYPCSSRLQVA